MPDTKYIYPLLNAYQGQEKYKQRRCQMTKACKLSWP